jgi:hypothetical protein
VKDNIHATAAIQGTDSEPGGRCETVTNLERALLDGRGTSRGCRAQSKYVKKSFFRLQNSIHSFVKIGRYDILVRE